MHRMTFALLLIASIAIFSMGCSHSGGDSLTGSWIRTVSFGTAHFDVMITFGDNDTFQFELLEAAAGHNDTEGQYDVSGSSVTFTDDDCGNSGVYSFTVTDDRLSLTPDNEPCDDRSSILSGTWDRAADK